jgi:hypothetical protein
MNPHELLADRFEQERSHLKAVAYSVVGFTVRGDRIVEIDVLADPARLPQLVRSGT